MTSRVSLLLTGVLATLAYLGLAILGWGGVRPFFAHPPLVALTVVLLLMSGASLFSSANIDTGIREDRSNRWVLTVFSVIGLLSAYLPAYTDRIGFLTLDGEPIRWIGVVLFTIGGALRLWPVFILGRRFSGLVAIQEGHQLVTDGIYGVIRHPSYLGMIILMIGWALAFRSGVGLLLAVAVLWPLLARIRAEEALLGAQFGAEFEAYRKRTWRLMPGLY